jgi:hypothetical protein
VVQVVFRQIVLEETAWTHVQFLMDLEELIKTGPESPAEVSMVVVVPLAALIAVEQAAPDFMEMVVHIVPAQVVLEMICFPMVARPTLPETMEEIQAKMVVMVAGAEVVKADRIAIRILEKGVMVIHRKTEEVPVVVASVAAAVAMKMGVPVVAEALTALHNVDVRIAPV